MNDRVNHVPQHSLSTIVRDSERGRNTPMAGTFPQTDLSAVVLAGGQSSRMGADKALLLLDDRTVIECILDVLEDVAADVFIVGERPEYHTFGVPVYPDRVSGAGPLAGLETALRLAKHDRVLLTGCDMPFLNVGLLRAMADVPFTGDALVPVRRVDGALRPEPLHAIYRKQSLVVIQERLAGGQRSLQRLLDALDTVELDEQWLRRFDPELASFTNMNTPAEARTAGVRNRDREEMAG